MFDREALYQGLPVWLQQAACNLEGWRINRSRFGAGFRVLLHELEERDSWPADRLFEFRDRRLHSFIRHCGRSVPFYRNLFHGLGLDPESVRRLEDLGRLPTISKHDVQSRPAEFISEAVRPADRISVHTSGTTGAGLRFFTTRTAEQEQWAVWWRFRRWHGIEPNTWCGYFGGRSVVPVAQKKAPFWRYNYFGRQIFFSGYHMSEPNLGAYVGELRRAKPPWLHGYPSLLALLAAFLIDKRADLGYRPRWITTGAENLLPQQGAVIQAAFGIKPRQNYGMAEAVANIAECELGGLHVAEDFAAVEFLPGPDRTGSRIIGVNLSNPVTPFVRYDIGDVVTIGDSKCSCGRAGRTVSSIDGRLEDYVVLSNGALLGRMDHIFKDMINVREAQLYQKVAGKLIVRIVPNSGYSQRDEAALLKEMRRRVGEEEQIEIDYVDEIERSPGGKLRFVVSESDGARLSALRSVSSTTVNGAEERRAGQATSGA